MKPAGVRRASTMVPQRRALIFGIVGLYVAGLGFLAGITIDRFRFDAQRNRVLAQYSQAVQRLHQHLMTPERSAQAERP